MEIYENHMGGIYFSEEILDYEYLYCDQCGDSDWYLGHADTWEDVLNLISEEDGWIPYAEDYINRMKIEFEERIRHELR